MKWICAGYTIDLSEPCVMGIVNITPDSFSDGGEYLTASAAIRHAESLVEQGAELLDLGAESSRPGADSVSVNDELARLMPVLEAVIGFGVPISVDTTKPAVMRAVLDAGASVINDINALQEVGALDVVAASNAGVCLMHMQGQPKTMQTAPRYGDVVEDVRGHLLMRGAACEAAGIAAERIVVDPGFGFGKTLPHNLALLGGLDRLADRPYPVLAGLSRKSMIGALTQNMTAPPDQREAGSLAAALFAVDRGARVLRVHDVRGTVEALRLWSTLRHSTAPIGSEWLTTEPAGAQLD